MKKSIIAFLQTAAVVVVVIVVIEMFNLKRFIPKAQ